MRRDEQGRQTTSVWQVVENRPGSAVEQDTVAEQGNVAEYGAVAEQDKVVEQDKVAEQGAVDELGAVDEQGSQATSVWQVVENRPGAIWRSLSTSNTTRQSVAASLSVYGSASLVSEWRRTPDPVADKTIEDQ